MLMEIETMKKLGMFLMLFSLTAVMVGCEKPKTKPAEGTGTTQPAGTEKKAGDKPADSDKTPDKPAEK
jgi:hypothetical protein